MSVTDLVITAITMRPVLILREVLNVNAILDSVEMVSIVLVNIS